MTEFLSYEALQTIWFVLWGLLWAVYFILDGFDLGMGTLLPVLAKNDRDRRVIYNAAGPFWDGNEVWLITAGGVTFAAFPKAYAVMFSALYAPLLLLLFALIFRAVSFEFRNKIDNPQWRGLWDIFQFLGNFVPALLLGVAFANLFQGIPIDTEGVYHGSLFGLLNLYGLLGGVLFVAIFALHGSLWLSVRAEGEMRERAVGASKTIWIAVVALAVAFLFATREYTDLYANYSHLPILWIFPILAVVLLLLLRFFLSGNTPVAAFVVHAGFILCTTFFGVLGMFPRLIPSNLDPAASITTSMAASSPLTLTLMLVVALICVPIVIGYQFWVYTMLSGKVTDAELDSEHSY